MKWKNRNGLGRTIVTMGFCALASCVGIVAGAERDKAPAFAVGTSTSTVQASYAAILSKPFDLAGPRRMEARYYRMQTKVVYFEANGDRKPPVFLRLYLKCEPAGPSPDDGHRYTCGGIGYQAAGGPEVGIPSLVGWSYLFKRTEKGDFNQGGFVLGIDQSRFQGLTDSNGNAMPPEMTFALHNLFIDFHTFCDQFARRTSSGRGIQDLARIGDKITHAAAFSEPTEHLAGSTGEGSMFKNGEITLAFNGLGILDEVPCAIVHFDSGDSSFNLTVNPTPDMEIKTVGVAHYWGDLCIELDSRWVRQCRMGELTVSQVMIGSQQTVNLVMERDTAIKALTRSDFEESSR